MATGAPRPCTHPGCRALVTKGSRCPAHPYKMQRTAHGKAKHKLYNTARWRRERRIFLNNNPLCVVCLQQHGPTPATVVDHITPHDGDLALFWDQSNWQPLCKRHHDQKTAREDGGFGNSNGPYQVHGCC
jgi:5-methylcytosine-specific restriction protein A